MERGAWSREQGAGSRANIRYFRGCPAGACNVTPILHEARDKMTGLEVKILHAPGHGPSTTIGEEALRF